MGAKNTKEVSNVNNFITDVTMESMTEINNKCNGKLSSEQIMEFDFDNTEVMNRCVSYWRPSECKELIGDVNISGNRQESEIFFEQNCEMSNDVAAEVAADVQGKLEAKASQETDAIADTLNTLSNSMTGGSSGDKTYNENNFKNNVKNVINTKFTTDMFLNVQSKLDMSFEFTGTYGSVAIQDNYQSILQEATSNALSNNNAVVEAVTKVEGDVAGEATQKQKGMFSALEDMFGMFGDNAMVSALCVFICACVCILVSAIAAFTFMNTDAEKIDAIASAAKP